MFYCLYENTCYCSVAPTYGGALVGLLAYRRRRYALTPAYNYCANERRTKLACVIPSAANNH
jgi:hypothetical protein